MEFQAFNLHPVIAASIKEAGYVTPTPIQQQAIPVVMAGHDLIATAQTGTGKTAAFVLPALQRLTLPATGTGREVPTGTTSPSNLSAMPPK